MWGVSWDVGIVGSRQWRLGRECRAFLPTAHCQLPAILTSKASA